MYCANDNSLASSICNYELAPFYNSTTGGKKCSTLGAGAYSVINAAINATYCNLTSAQQSALQGVFSIKGVYANKTAFARGILANATSLVNASSLIDTTGVSKAFATAYAKYIPSNLCINTAYLASTNSSSGSCNTTCVCPPSAALSWP